MTAPEDSTITRPPLAGLDRFAEAASPCVLRVTLQAVVALWIVCWAGVALAEGPPPTLRVESEPAGLEVRVNGRLLGVTPWEGVRAPGRHEVEVRRAGAEVQRRVVLLTSGPTAHVASFVFEATPEPGDPPGDPPDEPVLEPPVEPAPGGGEHEATDPMVIRVAGLASEGMVIADGSVLRGNVRLEVLGELDLGALDVFLAASVALEEPASFGWSVAAGLDLFGPVYARLGLAFLANPAFEVGVSGGVGADITLVGALFLHAAVDVTVWPGLHDSHVAVAVDGRLGLGAQF